MRYCYHSIPYRASPKHGIYCNPVKQNGKNVIGRKQQLVIFADGAKVVVVRRALRLREKCNEHG